MKFKFVEENHSTFPMNKMCHTSSSYYRWRFAPLSQRKIMNETRKKRITNLFFHHKGMVCSPIITSDLREYPKFSNVSRNIVAILMRDMGLECKTVKKL